MEAERDELRSAERHGECVEVLVRPVESLGHGGEIVAAERPRRQRYGDLVELAVVPHVGAAPEVHVPGLESHPPEGGQRFLLHRRIQGVDLLHVERRGRADICACVLPPDVHDLHAERAVEPRGLGNDHGTHPEELG